MQKMFSQFPFHVTKHLTLRHNTEMLLMQPGFHVRPYGPFLHSKAQRRWWVMKAHAARSRQTFTRQKHLLLLFRRVPRSIRYSVSQVEGLLSFSCLTFVNRE